ncbi:phytanoyl-CoA dioxygenase family protein [Chloroflexi bacterium TSY]|nr:phytanoyl-CoA dioxygenase family protein [Chloroflexi bacterium TSY]
MEDLLNRMKLDGWCVVEDVIPTDEVATVRAGVLTATEKHRNPHAPKNIGHLSGVINHDQSVAAYLADGRLMGLVETLLGPFPRVSFTTATTNEPGNVRGGWHADWPFNQRNAGHIPAPYPDAVMHLTTIWMLADFTPETGGTLVVSGSHRMSNNPTGGFGPDDLEPYPTEVNATGKAGDVLVMDSRLWHATAPNITNEPRVAIVIRYAPWWLDLSVLMPDSATRERMQSVTGKRENQVPAMPTGVYEGLPDNVKPLFAHWVDR